MPTTIKDTRTVRISVTVAELNTLLSDKAKQQGLIDFDPDFVQVSLTDPETGTYEIIFEKNTVPT